MSELDELLAELPETKDPLPVVEWWDKSLLEGGVYYHATPKPNQEGEEENEEGGAQEEGLDESTGKDGQREI